MRVTGLRVEEVGPFDAIDLTFRDGTDPARADTVLFVGPNGAGKSTLLYAIAGCFDMSPELTERMRSNATRIDLSFRVGHEDYCTTALPNAVNAESDRGRQITNFGPYKLALGSTDLWNQWYAGELGEGAQIDGARLVFGYSGTRTMAPGSPPAGGTPLQETLRFGTQNSFEPFRAWVSDILARRDSALVQGLDKDATAVSAGLRLLEEFLSELTDSPRRFVRRIDDGEILLSGSGEGVPLHLLPEGLKSVFGWMGDLLRRIYGLRTGGVPHHELPIVLLLDEIEVHLHPKWQRLVLPAVERLLPNAQIFLSTHSPFVLASATDAQIVWLSEDGRQIEELETRSLRGVPYTAVLEMMGITSVHDEETTDGLAALGAIAEKVRHGDAGIEEFNECAERLPHTDDVEITVDFQRAQLVRAIGAGYR